MIYDSTADTNEHINNVIRRMRKVCHELEYRAAYHDASKLEEPEKSGYDKLTIALKDVVYGSDAYRAALTEAKDVIAHHYAHNSHHPEYWPVVESGEIDLLREDIRKLRSTMDSMVAEEEWPIRAVLARTVVRMERDLVTLESRINGMSLLDLIEMCCDWKAASERTQQGSIAQSLAHNQKRFGVSDQLANILGHTVEELGW